MADSIPLDRVCEHALDSWGIRFALHVQTREDEDTRARREMHSAALIPDFLVHFHCYDWVRWVPICFKTRGH